MCRLESAHHVKAGIGDKANQFARCDPKGFPNLFHLQDEGLKDAIVVEDAEREASQEVAWQCLQRHTKGVPTYLSHQTINSNVQSNIEWTYDHTKHNKK